MNDDVDATVRRATELVVEPTRIGGRRSTLPGLIAALVAVGFLGVAIWKPWTGGPATPSGAPSPGSTPAAAAVPVPGVGSPAAPSAGPAVVPSPIAATAPHFPSEATMLAATTPERVWGTRAIAIRDGPPGFPGEPHVVERWSPAEAAVVGGAPPTAATAPVIDAHDDVAALGVTTLDDELALDVRFWVLPDGEPPRRLAPLPFSGPEPGSWLWVADPSFRTAAGTWPGGTYRIDVLTSTRIVHLMVVVARPTGPVIPEVPPIFTAPDDWLLAGVDNGLYALAGGHVRHLSGGRTAAADERGAWLGGALDGADVAHLHALDTSALGVILPAGRVPGDITVDEIAPAPGPIEIAVDELTAAPDDRRAIVAYPAELGLYPTGLYRVTVTSAVAADPSRGGPSPGATPSDAAAAPGGPFGVPAPASTDTWIVEVGPPADGLPPDSPLEAARAWAAAVDRPAARAGLPIVAIGDDRARCPTSTVVTGSDGLLGIVTPRGFTIDRLRMLPENVSQSADVAIRYAIDVVPRLTIVALPPGGLPVRDYSLFLRGRGPNGPTSLIGSLCVRAP